MSCIDCVQKCTLCTKVLSHLILGGLQFDLRIAIGNALSLHMVLLHWQENVGRSGSSLLKFVP